MQTKATVIRIENGMTIVEVERQAACDGCHKNKDGGGCSICSLTGGNRKFEATASNTLGAKVGDVVTVSTESGTVLRYAALVFMLPLIVGVAFYFVSGLLFEGEIFRYISLVFGFVLSVFFVWLYAKAVASKRLDVEIVEILEKRELP